MSPRACIVCAHPERTAIQEANADEREIQEAFEETNDAQRAVFASPELEGVSPPLAALSYRDALDRVRKLTGPHELADLIEQAVVTGDALLGKAVLWRAVEMEDGQLRSAYFSEFPENRPRWSILRTRRGHTGSWWTAWWGSGVGPTRTRGERRTRAWTF